ncbi:MAG: UvrD-helicase domain-containing protein [Planctomycetales bacterium]|nr:UvrD-helicase domain-containing protein [Planctomycetales bacterium]
MTATTSAPNMTEMPKPRNSQYTNELIRASAGTGKTYHLSNRYLRLVLDDVPVPQILATTFTRQAAREILDRILLRLAIAAETAGAAADLAMAIGSDTAAGDLGFQRKCMGKLRELTAALPRIRVSTLDAFFAQIAQAFSLEIGLPPGWRIVEEDEEAAIRGQAIDRYLGIGKPERVVKLMHLLSKGKAERSVSRMIADTVIDLYGMFLDSDRRAWNSLSPVKPLDDVELEEAIMELNACDVDQLDVVKAFKPAKNKDCHQAASHQWDAFLADGIAKNISQGLRTYGNGKKNEIPDSLQALYEPLIKHALALLRNQIALQTESTFTLLNGFDDQYQELKHDTRSLRFDDINRSLLPFAKADSFRQIAYRMNGLIEHLLLDEFQDTSLDQWRVIRPFAEYVARDSNRSFFCVGDVKQAIYGWRGADADILDQLGQQLPEIEPLELTDSYRSSETVIAFVNDVNRGLANHPTLDADENKAAEDWRDAFPTHATARKELPGHVTIETARYPSDDEEAQADLVFDCCAERVAELVNGCPSASVAVLTRSNDAVAKIIFRLQQHGVAASELGGNPLTDSAAVQLILSRLKLADHPGDSVAFFHLQNSPWADELKISSKESGPFSLSEQTRRQLADLGFGAAIETWANELKRFCNPREWRRLRQLVEMGFVFQRQAEQPTELGFSGQRRIKFRTQPFIRRVETQRVADPSADQVSVMTIHKSKGLQFDAVFVVELDKRKSQAPKCVAHRPSPFDGIDQVVRYVPSKILENFPAKIQRLHHESARAKFREDLCVLYVAITRAIHALHLIVAPSNPKAKVHRLPKTAAGLIRAAVDLTDPIEESTVVYETGDRNWFASKNANAENVESEGSGDSVVTKRAPIRLRTPADRMVSGLSPSSREGGGRVRLADRLSLESSMGMLYGTLVHAWFEQIRWLGDFDTAKEKGRLMRIAQQIGFPQQEAENVWLQFRDSLKNAELETLLDRDRFAQTYLNRASAIAEVQVRNEQPITALLDGQVTSGFVDRLVVAVDESGCPTGAVIIDYKTDKLEADDTNSILRKVDHYRPQLKAYRRAISQMLNLDPASVSSYLVFLNVGRVKQVT